MNQPSVATERSGTARALRDGRRRQAESLALALRRESEARPEDAGAWLRLARARALAGRTAEAREACEQALTRDPTLFRGHLLKAKLAAASSDGPGQITGLREAIALRPDGVALRLVLVGVLLGRVKNRAALVAAQEALAVAPASPSVLLALARCYDALGQHKLARTARDQARGAGPPSEASTPGRGLPAVHPGHDDPQHRPPSREVRPQKPREAGHLPLSRALSSEPTEGGGRQSPQPVLATRDIRIPQTFKIAWVNVDLERITAAPPSKASLIDQLLIVRALILRDLRLRHRGNRLGFLTEFVRPSIVVFVHYWLFYFLRKPMPAQIPIEAFTLGGFSIWFAFSAARGGAVGGSKWPGGAILLPGITELHMRFARAAWDFLIVLVFCLAAFIPLKVYGFDLALPDVPETCTMVLIAGGTGFGLGLTTERLGQVMPLVKIIEKVLIWATFVTAGLYFSIETVPYQIAGVFWFNPLLHLVEWQRHAFDPGYRVALLDLRYPLVVMMGLLTTGLLLYGSLRHTGHD